MVLGGTSRRDFVVVQQRLFQFVDDPAFHFRLPQLSRATWETLCNDDAERERLEFSGDTSMAAFVGSKLCYELPEGSPHQLSIARSALTANSTFARLMKYAGCGDTGYNTKLSGDAFEAIIGAYEKQSGHGALESWFEQNYMHLLAFAANVARSMLSKGKHPKRTPLGLFKSQIFKPFRASQRRRAVSRHSVQTPKKAMKTSNQRQCLPSSSLPETIDLTTTSASDWEDEQDEHTLVTDENEIVEISMKEFLTSAKKRKIAKVFILSRTLSRASSCSDLTVESSETIFTLPELGDVGNPIIID